jgi:thioesterase domain-containing protein
MIPLEIEAFLHERIPLTRALGCQVIAADESGVRLRAPLGPNVNVHGTAFAGSLASLSLLSGWVWVVLALRRGGDEATVVVRHCEVTYLAPIEGALEACCAPPESDAWRIFSDRLRERGRARLTLEATVSTIGGAPKVRTVCEYAVKRTDRVAVT